VLLLPADPDAKTDEIGNTNKQRQFTPADFNRLSINRIMASLSLQRGSGGSVCSGESDAMQAALVGPGSNFPFESDSILIYQCSVLVSMFVSKQQVSSLCTEGFGTLCTA
jgi:hypothetical protein